MEYGLIGNPLKHSFSKEIHSLISNYTYDLRELNENEFNIFMEEKKFNGINVTIPYKQKVIPYLDLIDDDAKNINAVNTIINRNGKLKGYNTDVLGVLSTFSYFDMDIKNKNVLILGTGATSNTLFYALKQSGVKKIYKSYRNSSKVKGDILYNEVNKLYNEIDIIINATSNGMFPHNNDSELVNISSFNNLSAVMDVIYNPLRSKILQIAENNNIKSISGLYMLVAQAVFASMIFTGVDIKNTNSINDTVEKIYKKCLLDKQNIVLTGMPTSGKSTIGKKISEKYNYEFIDTDELIENKINMPISNYIELYGEEKFRNIESQTISEISHKNHSVISTGGGVILKPINILNLKYNGKIFFINKPLDKLKPSPKRPLTSDFEKLATRYTERLPIYKKTCDVEIDGTLPDNDEITNIINQL